MMKKIFFIASAALLLAGCSKFLDINPKGEVFDADMFSSAEGYEDALYGIYNEIAESTDLYGAYLWWIPEALSQNVIAGTSSSDYNFGYMQLGDWYSAGPENIRSKVWSSAYKAINHVNNIISHAENGGTDALRHGNLYLGEALALRAMLHFDLLRIFGPPYWADASEKATTIPYVEKYSFDVTPMSSYDEVLAKVIADLEQAERLLAEDEELIPAERDNAATGFTGARITHLNLYAVQALLARVFWTEGDLSQAAIYAQKVIDSGKFSFRPRSAFVQPDNGTLDLSETIFGLYGKKYQSQNATKYNLTGTSASNTFLLASDWRELYEENMGTTADYRQSAWFNDGDQTLRKLVNTIYYEGSSTAYSGKSILGANVLRIPEMYFILAETYLDSNPGIAADYFNAVTVTRGREAVPAGRLTYDMLFRERRREFYGEGFTWHEMKRRGMDIPTVRGTVLPGRLAATYQVPVPEDEFEARNNVNR